MNDYYLSKQESKIFVCLLDGYFLPNKRLPQNIEGLQYKIQDKSYQFQ